VSELSQERKEVDLSIKETSNSIDTLKSAYAASTRFLYKQQGLHQRKIDPLFTEANTENARFAHYGKILGEAHARNHGKLELTRQNLTADKAELTEALTEQQSLMSAREREEYTIRQQKEKEARELAQLQVDKEKLRKELQKRLESARKLEAMIANLIAKEEAARKAERARRLAESKKRSTSKKSNKSSKEPSPTFYDDAFDSKNTAFRPNALMWPTSSHQIKQGFGEHRNAELNTITVNLGIDIGTPQGSNVVAVAEGEVSLVSSLPSYGTIVILRHAGGFHTVYANMQSVAVGAGSKVKAGQSIGRSGTNPELGSHLHFEIWKGKNKQNPTAWLR